MDHYPTIEKVVNDARARIEVTKAEIDEARKRRVAIVAALAREFVGSRHCFNGSVAHGDALTPLTDVDLGVVIPNPDGTYGPGRGDRANCKSEYPPPFDASSRPSTATCASSSAAASG
ncbi:hypothetical protein V6S02_09125 [Microbacterium sp. CCNWLW134]|uniref:hypothetical protein n=1 Tax=Microbacterium sp. CCNWLW134 TaxID=3122064 RepID=UPI003010474E